jgi:hypothetical protein
LTASEIDAHPDADRIWATITALREAFARDEEERVDAAVTKRVVAIKENVVVDLTEAFRMVRTTFLEAEEAPTGARQMVQAAIEGLNA